ncbi:DNA modification system-associated small protein [Bacillus sp. EB01]|uniref:DNA modification system-associated small protein n=1 Tax=Bacillus sp. EB01 TaxID=1347086 RepID=UPI0005C58087|nr:DNA modification system-associated small protein [Bacillus sp. EB01]
MKEIEKRELELLAKICHRNGIPLKLAKQLIKSAKDFSYENVSQSTRTSEYNDLIKINMKDHTIR